MTRKKELKLSRLAKKQKKALQTSRAKLIREFESSPEAQGRKVLVAPAGQKMSVVLLDFVAPHLKECATDRAQENVIGLGALIWNLALLPAADHEQHLAAAALSLASGEPAARPGLERAMRELLHRKLTRFGDNQRMILNYRISKLPDGNLHLDVMATHPDPGKALPTQ